MQPSTSVLIWSVYRLYNTSEIRPPHELFLPDIANISHDQVFGPNKVREKLHNGRPRLLQANVDTTNGGYDDQKDRTAAYPE